MYTGTAPSPSYLQSEASRVRYDGRPRHQALLGAAAAQQPLVVHLEHDAQPLALLVGQVAALRRHPVVQRPHRPGKMSRLWEKCEKNFKYFS